MSNTLQVVCISLVLFPTNGSIPRLVTELDFTKYTLEKFDPSVRTTHIGFKNSF